MTGFWLSGYRHRRIVAFTVVVAVLHGLVIWLWAEPFESGPTPPDRTTAVAVRLVPPPPPPVQVTAPAVTLTDTPSIRNAHSTRNAYSTIPPADREHDAVARAAPPRIQAPARLREAPRPLILTTPSGAPDAPSKAPGEQPSASGLEFRPDLAAAVRKRREGQALRQDLLESRQTRHGHDVATYNRVESANRHIKTDRGCFDRRGDVAGDRNDGTGGERFWMTRCRESARSRGWQLEAPAGY